MKMKSQLSNNLPSCEHSNTRDAKSSKDSLAAPDKSSSAMEIKDENRDEWDNEPRKDMNERENISSDRSEAPTTKRSQTRPSPSRKSKSSTLSQASPHHSPQRHYMHESYPGYHQGPPGRGPYHPPHAMHGGPRGPPPSSAPYPPPPPPHFYSGAPHDHYRGPPPPPHYHQMPPMPHPSQPGHYGGPNGHYCPPPNMAGRPGPPPPGYHAPYGSHYAPGPPPMGYHGAPPHSYPPQGNPSHTAPSSTSDSNSISSSKSKGSMDRRSTKSQLPIRKKRTIDGVHDHKGKEKGLPVAYTFRRSNSNASTSSTVTASNNAQSDTQHNEGSPQRRDRASSRSSNQLPPLSSSSNIFDDDRYHRRNYSGTSTASSLSVGGFSLSSYDGPRAEMSSNDIPILKSSPKRRKGEDSEPVGVDNSSDSNTSIFKRKGNRRLASPTESCINGAESSRFEKLSMNDSKKRGEGNGQSLFLSLSTSPINHPEVDSTPLRKNTNKKNTSKITIKTDLDDEDSKHPGKPSPIRKPKMIDRPADTPTPPIPGGVGESEMLTDEDTLNRHLRGQTFTPLPHMSENGISPTNGGFGSIAPQLSWSIAGDTPSLEDLATCSWEETDKDEKKRPGSTTSQLSSASRGMVISPHSFSLWKEEHELNPPKKGEDGKDVDSMRFSMLSPANSEIGMAVEGASGTTTPLPLFFDQPGSEERENLKSHGEKESSHSKEHRKEGEQDHIHHMFVTNGGRSSSSKHHYGGHQYGMWSKGDGHNGPPTPVFAGSKPPTPLFASSNMGFARSPLHGDRRDHHHDFFKPGGSMFGHPPPHHGSHNDRVRNRSNSIRFTTRRVPPGAHLAPMPIHIPPPMSSHHPLTSPMGIGHGNKAPLWSPHHGNMPPPMASPHHMSPMDMSQSKRKCVPLKPPIPSKFQGDMEKMKTATVPEFTSLVNFPAHMSQKQAVNLPEGMRCCVMCGQACPCSSGSKKKGNNGSKNNKQDGSLAPRSSNGQDTNNMMGDKNGYAIIPTQNKGLCTLCDVNVWVVVNSGLEIKWCKGCKNFRPWAAFGDKGLATKCLRCRERQREKYALQKEEKEKARLLKNAAKVKG